MTRTVITATIALITAFPLAGEPVTQATDNDIRMLGKTRVQVEKQFSQMWGRTTGLGVRYNTLNGRVMSKPQSGAGAIWPRTPCALSLLGAAIGSTSAASKLGRASQPSSR